MSCFRDEAAEEAAAELLLWHLQFDANFQKDQCDGATISRYQLEGMFGLLRSFRSLLLMAGAARGAGGGGPTFHFYPGRICNSYIEGRFSIFGVHLGMPRWTARGSRTTGER